MDSKTVEVSIDSKYGNTLMYPRNTNAILFAEMAGTKTLTVHTLGIVKQLGYEVIVVPVMSTEMQRIVSKA